MPVRRSWRKGCKTIRRNGPALAAAIAVALLAGGGARADELTFQGGSLVETFGSRYYEYTYTEGPMQIQIVSTYSDDQCFGLDGQNDNPCFGPFSFNGGQTYGLQVGLYANVYFSLVDGGAFDLDSFAFSGGGDTSLSAYSGASDVGGLVLTGLGGIVNPGADFSAITQVEWCSYCLSDFQPNNYIGDFTYTPLDSQLLGTPEPGSLALLLVAAFLAAPFVRRAGLRLP